MRASGEKRVPPASPPWTGQSRTTGVCALVIVKVAIITIRTKRARFIRQILILNLRLREGYGGPRRSAAARRRPNPSIFTAMPAAAHDSVELKHDVSTSPLWNADLAPTPLSRRTWSTYHIAALWIGMSVVITTYTLASGLMQQGMTWWQAILTILLGNSIVLLPMILNAHAGTKYGVSFPVLCRASFGVKGANVPAILRALVACGWFGIQTWIGAVALNTLVTALWPPWSAIAFGIWISFAMFWLVQVWIILNGL